MSFFMRSMHGSNKRQPKRILNENKNRNIDGYRVEEWERGSEKGIECWYTIWKYISENMNQKVFFCCLYLSLSTTTIRWFLLTLFNLLNQPKFVVYSEKLGNFLSLMCSAHVSYSYIFMIDIFTSQSSSNQRPNKQTDREIEMEREWK